MPQKAQPHPINVVFMPYPSRLYPPQPLPSFFLASSCEVLLLPLLLLLESSRTFSNRLRCTSRHEETGAHSRPQNTITYTNIYMSTCFLRVVYLCIFFETFCSFSSLRTNGKSKANPKAKPREQRRRCPLKHNSKGSNPNKQTATRTTQGDTHSTQHTHHIYIHISTLL